MIPRFAPALSASLLAFVLVACASTTTEEETVLSPEVEVGLQPSTIKGGGSSGGSQGSSCSSITCPDGKLDSCFIPCMQGHGTVAGCTRACECTAVPCPPTGVYAQ